DRNSAKVLATEKAADQFAVEAGFQILAINGQGSAAENVETVMGALFGIMLVESARKIGMAYGQSRHAPDVIPIAVLASARFGAAAAWSAECAFADLGKSRRRRAVASYEPLFASHLGLLIGTLCTVNQVFACGIRGLVYNPLPRRFNEIFDRSPGDDPRLPVVGNRSVADLRSRSARQLASYWSDYSKPFRGVDKASDLLSQILQGDGGTLPDDWIAARDEYLFLPGELPRDESDI
ncbi:MAG: hypothetical protein LBJ08_12725, partial [Bifidobacteriaceae bacterium]|nr:hypothetical protein [Bifidobacteriaceae bacterium]